MEKNKQIGEIMRNLFNPNIEPYNKSLSEAEVDLISFRLANDMKEGKIIIVLLNFRVLVLFRCCEELPYNSS